MSPAGGPSTGTPFIAGAGEYHDTFDDDTFTSTSLFNVENSPDTLQSLDAINHTTDQKAVAYLSPHDLTVTDGPVPDSPSDSFQDSSSDSAASWRRNDSSTSSKTPATTSGDVMMEDGDDVKMQWDGTNFGGFDGIENDYLFGDHAKSAHLGGATASTTAAPSAATFDFSPQDDSFMEQSFDFESASNSPKPATVDGLSIQSASTRTPATTSKATKRSNARSKAKTHSHTQKPSVGALSSPATNFNRSHDAHKGQRQSISSMNGISQNGSRAASPMSTLVASYDSSPAAMFNSPSPRTNLDSKLMDGNHNIWATTQQQTSLPISQDQSSHQQQQLHDQMMAALGIPHQMPFFNAAPLTGNYFLTILPTPLKSRVETQIHITLTLNALPPGATKLHLPTHTISKPKLVARPPPVKSSDMLELHVSLVCTSAIRRPGLKEAALRRATQTPQGYLADRDNEETSPRNGGDVRICQGCITRERKRAGRKKTKKPEDERLWEMDEERRVVVFNTQEIKTWKPLGSDVDPSKLPPGVTPASLHVSAPMRIACYCRHHGEKMGFNVIFTIKDWQDRVLSQAMSEPIMITDDHKTQPVSGPSHTSGPAHSGSISSVPASSIAPTVASTDSSPQPEVPPTGPSQVTFASAANADFNPARQTGRASLPNDRQTVSTRSLSRSASPNSGGPSAKKRKSSGGRVPNELAMTRLDTSPLQMSQASNPHQQQQSATSPYASSSASFAQPEAMFGQTAPTQPFGTGSTTPNASEQPFFSHNRSQSFDNLAMAQLYSAPVSNHGSRAPSPNSFRQSMSNVSQQQFAQALASSLYSMPMNPGPTQNPPIIHKIIPNEGPKIGGVEVTVLGGSFFQGLEVWFGDRKATTTTFWGETSLVCLLPPSPVAGVVPVSFQRQGPSTPGGFAMGGQPPMFKYVDDSEEKLIRGALSVLAHKMSGNIVDIRDLARTILDGPGGQWNGGNPQQGDSSSGSGGGGGGGGGFQQRGGHDHLEPQLLKVLDLIDLDDSPHRTRLDLKSLAGHTMLHYACSLGLHRFVAALLARGANPDVRDKGGFTPLHLAAINNHVEIIRRLMLSRADPTIRTLSGLTAADVAQSRGVLRAIETSGRHVRRHSRSSLHSRTSSATSLRSLWEPMAKISSGGDLLAPGLVGSDEESPEYTSEDFEDEDPDETFLHMRRSRRRSTTFESTEEEDGSSDSDSPTSPLSRSALKNQFQQQFHQWQQALALQLQNLPHLPQIPHMPQLPQMPALPGMPVLPDYHAYLQQAPFMRRMQQFMPGMSGRGTETHGDDHSPPKVDTRWWDLSSYMNSSAMPPPAYEDIFPQGSLDEKQASAAQAAAEAEADVKCTTLYDQPSTQTDVGSSSQATVNNAFATRAPIPDVLKIGRKNNITREQQENFLRAREEKMKRLSNDRKLFFVWIPLLVLMVCAMLYSYFPSLLPFIVSSMRSAFEFLSELGGGSSDRFRLLSSKGERVVEVA